MEKWLVLIAGILLVCIIEWIRELFTFRITHYQITSKKLNGLKKECKIVFLTDLHNNQYGTENKKLIEAVSKQNPDFIFIGGDMLVGKRDIPYTVAEKFVTELTTICPVYYANGNHEFRMKIYPETYGDIFQQYKKKLEKAGVIFLENNCENILLQDVPIQVYGLEIPREGYRKFVRTNLSVEQISEAIGHANHSQYQILMAHNPMYMESYKEWGADLILSGHLHGGVARIPLLGGVISPQFRLFPRYSGELTKDGNQSIVVSKGLGTHTIKMRFMNPAEVVVLHINGENK